MSQTDDTPPEDSRPDDNILEGERANDNVPEVAQPTDNVLEDTKPVILPPAPTLGRLLRFALLCGFVGCLVSLRTFSAATLPHILTQDGYNFQGIQEGLPVPRLLDWNPMQIGVLQQYTTLNPVLLALGASMLFGLLWICTLRVLFPTLRLFHAVPGAENVNMGTVATVALNSRLLLRMGSLFFMVGLPLAALTLGAFAPLSRYPALARVFPAAGFILMGIWLGFALRRGSFVARKLAPFAPASSWEGNSSLLPEIVRGATFGLLAYLLQMSAMRLPSQDVLRSLHALGTFHVARWNELGFHYLLSVSFVCFGLGLLFMLLAPLRTQMFPRLLCLVLVGLCAPLSLWLQRPYSLRSLAARWDITPPVMLAAWPYTPSRPGSGIPDGVEPAKELARLLHLALGNQRSTPDHRFLLFAKAGVFNALQHGYTEDGLTTDPASVPKVEAFLQRRDYNTALAWTAFKSIYNVGNVHFDSTLALRACLDDLEHYPHAAVVTRSVRDTLFTVAASPQNLALLNEWADEARFEHGDRACLKLMGDLYVRFGEQQKALEWYARADMPRSFMAGVRANKPLFHTGQVQGTVLWNGKPLVGAQMGAFPYLLNGLPKDLEGEVRRAEGGLVPPFAYSEKFGPYEPRPYQFRWMSAGTTTDSAGHFTLSHLTEGTYHLVCTLPAAVVLKPGQDERLHIVNAPGDITVRYARPAADLGTIALTFRP